MDDIVLEVVGELEQNLLGTRLKTSFRVMVWRAYCVFRVDVGVPWSQNFNAISSTHETSHWYALGFIGGSGLCQ